MPRNAGILEIDSYALFLMQPQCNTFIDDRAVARSSLQSLIQRFGRRKYVIKQPAHSKIEFLREVKSKTFVLECCCCELEKPNLTFDGEAGTRVVDLLMREASLTQQQLHFDTFLAGAPAGKPSDKPHSTRKCVEVIAVRIAHASDPQSRSNSEVPPGPGGTNLWHIVTSFTQGVGYIARRLWWRDAGKRHLFLTNVR